MQVHLIALLCVIKFNFACLCAWTVFLRLSFGIYLFLYKIAVIYFVCLCHSHPHSWVRVNKNMEMFTFFEKSCC